MTKREIVIARVLLVANVVIWWQNGSLLFLPLDLAIARPTSVGAAAVELMRGFAILPHILATGGAALGGLCLGTLLGTLLGLLTWFSRTTTAILRPFVVALGAMPILAMAPLMILWFGIGIKMKIALAGLSTVFVAFAQSSRGADNVSKHFIEVLRGMNASRRQIFVKAVFPGSLDWVFSAMRINSGLALLGAFIGEFISSNAGLGYLVLRASSLYNVPRAIAAALFIVLIALLFDYAAGRVEHHRSKLIMYLCIPRSAR